MPDMTLTEKGGRWIIEDPEGKLSGFPKTLQNVGGYFIPQGPRWGFHDITPVDLKWLTDLVEDLNKGRALPKDDPAPKANPKNVEIAEANRRIYVSGPYHLMVDSINTRLKSQGFEFDYGTSLWSTPASKLTPLKRKNLEKVVAPFVSGGKGDLRSPKQKILDDIGNRKVNGLCLRVPYELKDRAKALGGLWDDAGGLWCMPDQASYNAIKDLMENTPAAVAQREITRRITDKLCVSVPYELKDEAKALGGLWNGPHGMWCMPDAASKAKLLEKNQELEQAKAKAVADKYIAEQDKKRQDLERRGVVVVTQEGSSRGDHYPVGYIFKDRKTGRILQVSEVKSSVYIHEDGLSFGLRDDSGWLHTLYAVPAPTDEAQAHQTKLDALEVDRAFKANASKRRKEIQKYIGTHGKHPPGDHDLSPWSPVAVKDGHSRAYGGGDWFVITNDSIWHVQNNGHDGDAWDFNNVLTGGAGAIGWVIPMDKDLAQELLALDKVLTQ